jgi:hypothetical protein
MGPKGGSAIWKSDGTPLAGQFRVQNFFVSSTFDRKVGSYLISAVALPIIFRDPTARKIQTLVESSERIHADTCAGATQSSPP